MIGRAERSTGALAAFAASTRAGATALTSVLLTVAAFLGAGLAGDHVSLVGQRDQLQAATNAGTLAAIKHFQGLDINKLSDADIEAELRGVAERYLLANVPTAWRRRVRNSLEMTLVPHRATRTVQVSTRARLLGLMFLSGWVRQGEYRPDVRSGGFGNLARGEVVLALDTTHSMLNTVNDEWPGTFPDYAEFPVGQYPLSRITIVKAAAQELVDILSPDGVAVGLVPWASRVRLGPDQRARWVQNRWATYPVERTYPTPFLGAPDGGETATMPPAADQEPWHGCVDQRSVAGATPPGLTAVPPWNSAFTMAYYTHTFFGAWTGFTCQTTAFQNYCYDPDWDEGGTSVDQAITTVRISPQHDCEIEGPDNSGSPGHIIPLTTDTAHLRDVIGDLGFGGDSTYSAIGLAWARRLLDPAWRPVWGDPVVPRNWAREGDDAITKAIVLLTDGRDTQNELTHPNVHQHFDTVCSEAKEAGIRIFIIGALALSDTEDADFVQRLRNCSSDASHPDTTHVYINNATPEKLRQSFRDVAYEIQKIRLTAQYDTESDAHDETP